METIQNTYDGPKKPAKQLETRQFSLDFTSSGCCYLSDSESFFD
jgi:hypothetical protein